MLHRTTVRRADLIEGTADSSGARRWQLGAGSDELREMGDRRWRRIVEKPFSRKGRSKIEELRSEDSVGIAVQFISSTESPLRIIPSASTAP